MDPCTPNFGNSNPCSEFNPQLIREQGPPGTAGVPGGTPAFLVGSVQQGASPAVTLTQVNPLLYRIDFIIPGASLGEPNIWTATQTFTAGIVTDSIEVSGGTLTDTLRVTGAATFESAVEFSGAVDFLSSANFQAGLQTSEIDCTGNTTVGGAFAVTNILPLPAAKAFLGTVVADSCGRLWYIQGAQGPNSVASGAALAQTVTFNQSETAIAFTLPFTVPTVADCGAAGSVSVNIFGRIVTNAGGALPTDISGYIVRVRLDDAVTGTELANIKFTNFELTGLWNVNQTISPGAHILYFTVQGLTTGSSSIDLTEIDCSVNF